MEKITKDKKEKIYRLLALALFLLLVFSAVFFMGSSSRKIPSKVLIQVLDSDKNPILNASCKADITTENEVIEDKLLKEIENIRDVLPAISLPNQIKDSEKGFYQLDTGIEEYKGNFEIKIVCISPQAKEVGYVVLNNTNIPCEVKDKGKVVIC